MPAFLLLFCPTMISPRVRANALADRGTKEPVRPQVTRDVTPAVTADFCPACDESITDMAETERVMREMQAFNKQVNAAIVDPAFIVNVRKKLDLGQREAAEIFGGGINAFSRYENGKTKPPLALVKLFKLLDRHPDLLSEVRTD